MKSNYKCEFCGARNEQPWICSVCEGTVLVEIMDFEEKSQTSEPKIGLFRCAVCDYINQQDAVCINCDCKVLFEFELTSAVDDEELLIGGQRCPICSVSFHIDEINCGVFRCGVTKNGGVPPHASKAEMDEMERIGIWLVGCKAPLFFNKTTGKLEVIYTESGEMLYK